MKFGRPSYYDRFHCIAGDCPDSCCKEWTVDIDRKTAEMYASMSGSLGQALRAHLKEEDGAWVLETLPDGRCPMWRRDGLCRIQAEAGEEALSCVCRKFPRLTHDYGDFLEQGLELSCPEAAKWILAGEGAWLEEENGDAGEEAEYDLGLMRVLLRGRDALIRLLQDPAQTVPRALYAALCWGARFQAALDGEEIGDIQPDSEAHPEEILAFFRGLEILNPAWLQRLAVVKPGPWSQEIRNLAVYFVRRYFLQAVSDGMAADRVRLAVLSCLVIHLLGGDICDTAQKYSKEIENDPDNLDAVLDGFCFEKCLSDGHLAACLAAE